MILRGTRVTGLVKLRRGDELQRQWLRRPAPDDGSTVSRETSNSLTRMGRIVCPDAAAPQGIPISLRTLSRTSSRMTSHSSPPKLATTVSRTPITEVMGRDEMAGAQWLRMSPHPPSAVAATPASA